MPVTIHIYDDNDQLRKSIEDLLILFGEFVITGSFSNCTSAAAETKASPPDIILMDIDMPHLSGIEAVRQIRTINRNVPVLMLTVFEDNIHILDAIRAGASGYLLKKHLAERLVSSIKEVMEEGASLSPSVARMIIASMQVVPVKTDYGFSKREQEILTLLCKGNSYKMIAATLQLSFETIRTHIKKVYEKLQVHSATEAVSKAINEKLV